MKGNRRCGRVKVSADGTGVVSRAGVVLLRELSEHTGLAAGWNEGLLDTYRMFPAVHMPGRVLADLAVLIADGGDALAPLATLRDQDKLFGAVASDATAWRCVDRVDDAHLARYGWCGPRPGDGRGPRVPARTPPPGLTIDIDATITIAHSEKENAAKTWKKTPWVDSPTGAFAPRWPPCSAPHTRRPRGATTCAGSG